MFITKAIWCLHIRYVPYLQFLYHKMPVYSQLCLGVAILCSVEVQLIVPTFTTPANTNRQDKHSRPTQFDHDKT